VDFFKNLQNFVEIFGENPENFGGNFENPEKSPRPAHFSSLEWIWIWIRNGFGFGFSTGTIRNDYLDLEKRVGS
jgi:hypothetical protein